MIILTNVKNRECTNHHFGQRSPQIVWFFAKSIGQRRFPFSRWNRRDCPMSNDVIRLERHLSNCFIRRQSNDSLPPTVLMEMKFSPLFGMLPTKPWNEKIKRHPIFFYSSNLNRNDWELSEEKVTRASSVFKSIVLFYMCEISHTNFEWRKNLFE